MSLNVMNYEVLRGLREPIGRPLRRSKLDALIKLSDEMQLGDAAVLSLSESQQFRIILNAKGFRCLTDGYRCERQNVGV